MGRIIAVTNQKGGVGKTTTAINLSAALQRMGNRVLLVDTDPQGHATLGMGIERKRKATIKTMLEYIIIEEDYDPSEAIVSLEEGIDLVPANILLEGVEMTLTTLSAQPKEYILKKYLETLRERYDYILIDCRPALGALAVNALTAADSVLIPVQPEAYAVDGMQELFKTIHTIQQRGNPDLQIEGIVFTLYNDQTNQSRSFKNAIRAAYGEQLPVFKTEIPERVAISEAAGHGISILTYAERCRSARPAAQWYMSLAEEVQEHAKP